MYPLVAGVQHERERRLRVLLPLVLDREGDAHSDLSLDSAAELLHAAITAEPALRGAALEEDARALQAAITARATAMAVTEGVFRSECAWGGEGVLRSV